MISWNIYYINCKQFYDRRAYSISKVMYDNNTWKEETDILIPNNRSLIIIIIFFKPKLTYINIYMIIHKIQLLVFLDRVINIAF